jgi:hypothetical protein
MKITGFCIVGIFWLARRIHSAIRRIGWGIRLDPRVYKQSRPVHPPTAPAYAREYIPPILALSRVYFAFVEQGQIRKYYDRLLMSGSVAGIKN